MRGPRIILSLAFLALLSALTTPAAGEQTAAERLAATPAGEVSITPGTPVADALKVLETFARKTAADQGLTLRWQVQLPSEKLAMVCGAELTGANALDALRGLSLACGLTCELRNRELRIGDPEAAFDPLVTRSFPVRPEFWDLLRHPLEGERTREPPPLSPAPEGERTREPPPLSPAPEGERTREPRPTLTPPSGGRDAARPATAAELAVATGQLFTTCGLVLPRGTEFRVNLAEHRLNITSTAEALDACGRLLRALRATPYRRVLSATLLESTRPNPDLPVSDVTAALRPRLDASLQDGSLRRLAAHRVELSPDAKPPPHTAPLQPPTGFPAFSARFAVKPLDRDSLLATHVDLTWTVRANGSDPTYEQSTGVTLLDGETLLLKVGALPEPWHPTGPAFLALAYQVETLDGQDYAADGLIQPAPAWPDMPATRAALLETLSTIKLPSADFDEVHVIDVLREIRSQAQTLAPPGTTIRVFLLLPPMLKPAKAEPAHDDHDAFGEFPADDPGVRTIKMTMSNIPVGEVIRYVCLGAGLRFELANDAVWITDKSVTVAPMELRGWSTTGDVFARDVTPDLLPDEDDDMPGASGAGHATGSVGSPEATCVLRNRGSSFMHFGVEFPAQSACVSLDTPGYQLILVRNTPRNMAKAQAKLFEIVELPLPTQVLTMCLVETGTATAQKLRAFANRGPAEGLSLPPLTADDVTVLAEEALVVEPGRWQNLRHSRNQAMIESRWTLKVAASQEDSGKPLCLTVDSRLHMPGNGVIAEQRSSFVLAPDPLDTDQWPPPAYAVLEQPVLATGSATAVTRVAESTRPARFWVYTLTWLPRNVVLQVEPDGTRDDSKGKGKPTVSSFADQWKTLEAVKVPAFALQQAPLQDALDQLNEILVNTRIGGKPMQVESYVDMENEPDHAEDDTPPADASLPADLCRIGFVQYQAPREGTLRAFLVGDWSPNVTGDVPLNLALHDVTAATIIRALALMLVRAVSFNGVDACFLPESKEPEPRGDVIYKVRVSVLTPTRPTQDPVDDGSPWLACGADLLEVPTFCQTFFSGKITGLIVGFAERDRVMAERMEKTKTLMPPQTRIEVRSGADASGGNVTQVLATDHVAAHIRVPDPQRPSLWLHLRLTAATRVAGERCRVAYEIRSPESSLTRARKSASGTLDLTSGVPISIGAGLMLSATPLDATGRRLLSLATTVREVLAEREAAYQATRRATLAKLPVTPVKEFRLRQESLAQAARRLQSAIRQSGLPTALANVVVAGPLEAADRVADPAAHANTRTDLAGRPLADILTALCTVHGCRVYIDSELLIIVPAKPVTGQLLAVSNTFLPPAPPEVQHTVSDEVDADRKAYEPADPLDRNRRRALETVLARHGVALPITVSVQQRAEDLLRLSGPTAEVARVAEAIQRLDVPAPAVACSVVAEPTAQAPLPPPVTVTTAVGTWAAVRAPGLPPDGVRFMPGYNANTGRYRLTVRWDWKMGGASSGGYGTEYPFGSRMPPATLEQPIGSRMLPALSRPELEAPATTNGSRMLPALWELPPEDVVFADIAPGQAVTVEVPERFRAGAAGVCRQLTITLAPVPPHP